MLIQAFEWSKLVIGDEGFTKKVYSRLVVWQIKQEKKYFEIGHNFIKFTQWVGVIQVKGATIEVLPKLSNVYQSSNKDENNTELTLQWKRAFIQMLIDTGWVKFRNTNTLASLSLYKSSLLDIYYLQFAKEVETLLRSGLSKKYSKQVENRTFLKGKILFSQNITKNLIHKERFYTRADNYDKNHFLNQVLKAALEVTQKKTASGGVRNKVMTLLCSFDGIDTRRFNTARLSNISFDRKTQQYEFSINLAKLILLSLNPANYSGESEVVSLFFDMNQLWEDWLLSALKRKYSQHPTISVIGKKNRTFWASSCDSYRKQLETDILVNIGSKKVILDAKWKVPEEMPSDADIKQMFAYNHLWESDESWLCYPYTNNSKPLLGRFKTNEQSSLGTWYYNIFDTKGRLVRELSLPSISALLLSEDP